MIVSLVGGGKEGAVETEGRGVASTPLSEEHFKQEKANSDSRADSCFKSKAQDM